MEHSNISLSRGIHRTPSLGPDGEMSECINLIPRNGELVNIFPPTKIAGNSFGVVDPGKTLTIHVIHHVSDPNEDHIVYAVVGTNSTIYYQCRGSGSDYTIGTINGEQVEQITAIGNVICVTTNASIHYYLWENNAYTDLEDADFDIDIQFGIKSSLRQATSNDYSAVIRPRSSDKLNNYDEIARASGADSITYVASPAPQSGDRYSIKIKGAPAVKGERHLVITFEQMTRETDENGNPVSDENDEPVYRYLKKSLYNKITAKTEQFDFIVPDLDEGYTSFTPTFVVKVRDTYEESSWVLAYASLGQEDSYNVYSRVKCDLLILYRYNSSQSAANKIPEGELFYLSEGQDVVMGLVNEMVNSATKDNKFMMPFFVRYAVKLTTGHIINLSAPCLLEPNDLYAPVVQMGGAKDDEGVFNLNLHAYAFVSDIYYHLVDNGALDRIRKLGDVVDSIVVAITPPIYLYDQSVNEESGLDDSIIKLHSQFGTNTHTWGNSVSHTYSIDGINSYNSFMSSTWYDCILPTGGNVTIGTMPDAIKERMKEALSTWYIVKEVSIRSLRKDSNWTKLSLEAGTLAAIYAQDTERFTTLADTAVSSYKLVSTNGVFSYNNRLFYLGGTQKRHEGWNPVRMSGFTKTWSNGSTKKSVTITLIDGTTINKDFLTNGNNGFTDLRFWAYPDASANRISYYSDVGGDRLIYLYPQGTQELAVSFHFDPDSSGGEGSGSSGLTTYYPNKLYMSYANQPLVLDRNASLTFTGVIRSMSVVTQALSQGQFGQFPIYVFTSDGIWTLEVSSNGAIASSHPVSRDVITEGTKPLQTDTAIFFITEQGLKRLVGSQVTLVSEPVHGFRFPANMIGGNFADGGLSDTYSTYKLLINSASTSDFLKKLQKAKLLYDYSQHLVHVFFYPTGIETENSHYVFSLETEEWAEQVILNTGTTPISVQANPDSIVPGYPNSILKLGMDIYEYAFPTNGNTTNRHSVAVTRPIAFGDPTAFKCLMDFRIIGQQVFSVPRSTDDPFYRRAAVYVSKDGRVWRPLRSLKVGSFKYFRFVIMSCMTDAETLTGITAAYQTRRNHRLR